MSKTMKYNELNKYIVKCKRMANVNDDETSYPSGDEERNLADYENELKPLFESKEEVDIKIIVDFLKEKESFKNIISIEPIN